ncbi:metal ABC transporter solute-binding protein, Zn/Mn family [Lacticaseibacillus sp. GG6-2]
MSKFLLGLAITLTLGIVLMGCRSPQRAASHDKLNVVASVDFYGEVAKAVLGDHGQVTEIIDRPNVDPHDYEPTATTGKQVAKADVVVTNGAGYDSWMNKLVKGSGNGVATVSAAKVVGVKDGENEHIWYKPQTMPKMANALAKAFGKQDPAHKADYKRNAKRYIAELKPLLALIDKLKANASGKRVAVSEPVFVNALNYLGYQVSDAHFANAIEESTDPSPADIRRLETDIKQHKIAFFVQNTQVQNKVVDHLVKQCRAAGVPVLKVTETLPAGKTYTEWMTAQYQALEKIQTEQ